MKKLPLLLAASAGYVLGTRAGRQRYEQIAAGARRVARDPRVRSAAHQAQDAVAAQAAAVADVAKEKASGAASAAADKVRREASVSPTP